MFIRSRKKKKKKKAARMFRIRKINGKINSATVQQRKIETNRNRARLVSLDVGVQSALDLKKNTSDRHSSR